MNSTTNDLSIKLVYVAILAGLVLAFTGPVPAISASTNLTAPGSGTR